MVKPEISYKFYTRDATIQPKYTFTKLLRYVGIFVKRPAYAAAPFKFTGNKPGY